MGKIFAGMEWEIFFFLEDQLTSAPYFEIYTDAAGSVSYGGYFQGHWFNRVWTNEQQLDL